MKTVKNKLKIAITGIVGSGKSSVTKVFEDNNFPVFNADLVTHELLNNNINVYNFIKENFEECIENDAIVRSKLSAIIFANDENVIKLNQFMHPIILAKMQLFLQQNTIAIAEIPLLFEVGFEKYFDIIIVVSTNEELRYKRLLKKGWSIEKIESISKKQIPLKIKEEKADVIISNNADIDSLIKNTENWIKENLNDKD